MSTTPGLHAPPPTQYVHYTTVSPADTQHQKAPTPRAPAPASPSTATVTATASPTPNANASASATTGTSTAPVVAKGNWTKDLVQLAKTAELKKHALTLQLHTAHILSAHASLEQKNRAVQDIREQKNKLESERVRLLGCLRQVNEDRDKADLLESGIDRECTALRSKIATLSAGEYAAAKADVDRLRADLGQPPLPSLQSTLDEKGAQYLADRRAAGSSTTANSTTNNSNSNSASIAAGAAPTATSSPAPAKRKRNTGGGGTGNGGSGNGDEGGQAPKRPRGRPRGSKAAAGAGAAGVA